ncbi:MAG TPA: hypothetical protein VNT20_14235 [Flavisolibacter sp.]|jgi:hypothetical protein|nr:hypothetical protein [Flavisolibacter sp.]
MGLQVQPQKIQITVEQGNGEWWGWINGIKTFLPTSVADTIPELINNLRELLKDWQRHEAKEDPVWSKVNFDQVEFETVEYKEEDYE